jgi:hypothetical protein
VKPSPVSPHGLETLTERFGLIEATSKAGRFLVVAWKAMPMVQTAFANINTVAKAILWTRDIFIFSPFLAGAATLSTYNANVASVLTYGARMIFFATILLCRTIEFINQYAKSTVAVVTKGFGCPFINTG